MRHTKPPPGTSMGLALLKISPRAEQAVRKSASWFVRIAPVINACSWRATNRFALAAVLWIFDWCRWIGLTNCLRK